MTRGEIRLACQAVNRRWPIPAETRAKLVERCQEILDNPEAGDRAVLGVGKLLLLAEGQNQRDEERADPRPAGLVVSEGPDLSGLTAEELRTLLGLRRKIDGDGAADGGGD